MLLLLFDLFTLGNILHRTAKAGHFTRIITHNMAGHLHPAQGVWRGVETKVHLAMALAESFPIIFGHNFAVTGVDFPQGLFESELPI